MAATRPNILLIVTDEERFNVPRPDGFRLPGRERIAEQGVTFERYYAASTMCSSSRSVMYTGRHMPVTEVYDNDNMPYVRPLDPALGTIGTMLGSAGYHCSYQGKWHLSNAYLSPDNPAPTTRLLEPYGFFGWNDWGDIDGGAWAGLQIDPVIAGQAARWLSRDRETVVAEGQPWFLAVNFVNPHDIMSFDYGGRAEVQIPGVFAHAVVKRPPADIPMYRATWDVDLPRTRDDDLSGAPPAVHEFARVMDTVFGPVDSDDGWRAGMSFYLNCMRDVDRSVEVVLDALEATGEADRTVILFTADHGDLVGSHGLRQKGNLVYDENFHVPLVVSHPDVAGGGRTSSMASAVDLVPTMLAFAGVRTEDVDTRETGLPGASLVGALEGRAVRDGVVTAAENLMTLDASFWQEFGTPDAIERAMSGELRPSWDKRGFLRGWTDERYSFGRYFSPIDPNRPRTLDDLYARNDVVLYDRETDPDEVVNLATDPAHRALVATLSAKLEAAIDAEIGEDSKAWVTERPNLHAWPKWNGDRTRAPA